MPGNHFKGEERRAGKNKTGEGGVTNQLVVRTCFSLVFQQSYSSYDVELERAKSAAETSTGGMAVVGCHS